MATRMSSYYYLLETLRRIAALMERICGPGLLIEGGATPLMVRYTASSGIRRVVKTSEEG
jgi:hypothetical protein